MTQHKHLKNRIRSRMEKTGESYVAARRQVVARGQAAPPAAATSAPAASTWTPALSDDAVRNRTGRDWEAWFEVLDRARASRLDHRGIVALLSAEGVGSWWRQTIAVGYERARGLRAVHQQRDGSFQAGVSKTLPVAVDVLWRAWSGRRRTTWLEHPEPLTVRKSVAPRRVAKPTTPAASIRFASPTGVVEVRFFAKPKDRSAISVEQQKLPTAEAVAAFKATWKANLERLASQLTS